MYSIPRTESSFAIPSVSMSESLFRIPSVQEHINDWTIPSGETPIPNTQSFKRKRLESRLDIQEPQPTPAADKASDFVAEYEISALDNSSPQVDNFRLDVPRAGEDDCYAPYEDAALSGCAGFYGFTPNLCVVQGWDPKRGATTVKLPSAK